MENNSNKSKELLEFLKKQKKLFEKKKQNFFMIYISFSIAIFLLNISIVILAALVLNVIFSDKTILITNVAAEKVLPGVLAFFIIFLFFYNIYLVVKGTNTKYYSFKKLYHELEYLFTKLKFDKEYLEEHFMKDWKSILSFYDETTKTKENKKSNLKSAILGKTDD